MGVVVRRYIDFLILHLSLLLLYISVLFCSSIPIFCFHFFNVFRSLVLLTALRIASFKITLLRRCTEDRKNSLG